MSFGNAISAAFFLVSCTTGITGTVWSDAEQATYTFADVARMRRFDWAISTSNPDWFREGMRLFPYTHSGQYWIKRTITWTVLKYDIGRWPLAPEFIEDDIDQAFKKWAAVMREPFNFVRAPGRQADLQFTFEYCHALKFQVELPQQRGPLDHHVPIRLTFDYASCWENSARLHNHNFAYAALFGIGRCLGLGQSNVSAAMMCYSLKRLRQWSMISRLHDDDIRGIQALYNGQTRTHSGMDPGSTNRTFSGMGPGSTNRTFSGMGPGSTNRTFSGMDPQSMNRMFGGMYPGSTNQTHGHNPAPSSSSSSTSASSGSSTSASSSSSTASDSSDDDDE